ncbi:phage/plasmid primase, P4 family [Methylorubrum extorquens]
MNTITPKTYIDNGYDITVLYPKTKRPMLPGWGNITLNADDFDSHGSFPNDYNIGIKLGSASDGVVDIDLDCAAAVWFGQSLLNTETQVFGRDNNPASHYLYCVPDAQKTLRFNHPITGKGIVELRGNGGQTVLPGSIYEDGSTIRFENHSLPEPLLTNWGHLKRQCGFIAAGCVLSEFWTEGNRHRLAVALGGWAAHKGVNQAQFVKLIDAVARYANDDDVGDRLTCVENSYSRLANGHKVAWKDTITQCIPNDRVMNKVADWLGVEKESSIAELPAVRPKLPHALSDVQSGKDFCKFTEGRLIFCDDEDQFYYCSNGVFDPVTVPFVKAMVTRYVDSFDVDMTNYEEVKKLKSAQSISRINAIVDLARANLRRPSSEFNTDPFLVGCGNGVLDLRSGELVEPDCIITRRIGTTHNPDAWCHSFIAFLNQVFDGDEEKIGFIRRAVGYTLTGKTSAQCMFVLIGTGANGKSTFSKIIEALMGDYSGSIPSHSLMVAKYGNDKTDDIASLVGKRFVSASEGEVGQKLAVAKVKLMTGSDTIPCRPLYGKYFNMAPEFKIWFGTNDLPIISGGDEAIWRRLHVIDFPISFPEAQRDRGLFDRLKLELPGILNWALQGVQELGEMTGDFLNPPASVRNQTRRYRSSNDTVASFVDARCDRIEGKVTMMNTLYGAYSQWCNNGSIEPLSSGQFGKEMTRLGFDVKAKKDGNARLGIGLKG